MVSNLDTGLTGAFAPFLYFSYNGGTLRTLDDINYAFKPVGKLDEVKHMKLMHLENGFLDLAQNVCELIPESPDRTAALRQLLQAKMSAVQALTHDEMPSMKAQTRLQAKQSMPQTPSENSQTGVNDGKENNDQKNS